MSISIAARLKPFSHLPGAACLIPYTPWQVEAYPELLKFHHLVTGETSTFSLGWKGPVLDFTVVLNLEQPSVEIFGHTLEGYRYCRLKKGEKGILLTLDKQEMLLPLLGGTEEKPLERLSLGSHRKLDWDRVCRQKDLCSMIPVWNRLGQMTPHFGQMDFGTDPKLLEIFLAHFHGILAPCMEDFRHQAICCPKPTGSPLALLTEGARLIRSFFFQEKENTVALLPHLPRLFHSGRFTHLHSSSGHQWDLEWASHRLRRVTIHPTRTEELILSLPKPLKAFRLKYRRKDRGIIVSSRTLSLEIGKTVFLDRFF